MPRALLLLPLFLLTACYADELEREMTADPFFDLAAYIDAQVDSLEAAAPTVTKTIELNGKRETKQLTDLDFANDLRVFRAADINRPAWLDKYNVDRRREAGEDLTIYTATDSTLQTRRLVVYGPSGAPRLILIDRRTGTVLSDGNHRLEYRPAAGYRVRTDQVNKFGDDVVADIEVSW